MKRRNILTKAFAVTATGFTTWLFTRTSNLILPNASASDGNHAFEMSDVNEILLKLFDTDQVVYDASIKIEAPKEAENPKFVPFRISIFDAEKIAIFVDKNSKPLLMTVEGEVDQTETGNVIKMVSATMNLESSSNLSCYVLRKGELFHNSRFIDVAQSGYTND